jgi:hypothetical protein
MLLPLRLADAWVASHLSATCNGPGIHDKALLWTEILPTHTHTATVSANL